MTFAQQITGHSKISAERKAIAAHHRFFVASTRTVTLKTATLQRKRRALRGACGTRSSRQHCCAAERTAFTILLRREAGLRQIIWLDGGRRCARWRLRHRTHQALWLRHSSSPSRLASAEGWAYNLSLRSLLLTLLSQLLSPVQATFPLPKAGQARRTGRLLAPYATDVAA